jgi:hypothetical protein
VNGVLTPPWASADLLPLDAARDRRFDIPSLEALTGVLPPTLTSD